MRSLLVFSSLITLLLAIQLSTKQAYASHSGNFAGQCFLESDDGNCENANVPTGCTSGNTGNDCCADRQTFYRANGHSDITATCANTCSYDFAAPNIFSRGVGLCPVRDKRGGLSTFCCQYSTPTPTPTPTPN